MLSAVTSFWSRATMYALTGLWIQPAFPCWSDSLLLASVHERTSGSMQSRYIFLYHSITSTVWAELILTGLPPLSLFRAPEHRMTGEPVEIESKFWLMGMPTGLPIFFSSRPTL